MVAVDRLMQLKLARYALSLTACLVLLASPSPGQVPPRLQAVFPAGGQAGSTVEVVFRGGLGGAQGLLIHGDGVTGALQPGGGAVDETARPLFEVRCSTCHELRSPDNRQMAPAQWEQTVDRMIRRNGADINAADRDAIVAYLRARAAAGLVVGTLTLAADTPPGARELRVVTGDGVSTAHPFLVSSIDELIEQEPNNDPVSAPVVPVPSIVNGVCEATGDVDTVRFEAQAGQPVVLQAAAYALNPESQSYFDACLFVTDADGKPLARSLGDRDLDPLLTFTPPADGVYTVTVRDLLYRGGPANVYRLQLSHGLGRESVYPLGGRRGSTLELFSWQQGRQAELRLSDRLPLGVQRLATPFGVFPLHLGDLPEVLDNQANGTPETAQPVTVPAIINGWLGERDDGTAEEADHYRLDVPAEAVGVLGPWAVVGPFPSDPAGLDQVFEPEPQVLGGAPDVLARQYAVPGGDGQPVMLTWAPRPPNPRGVVDLPAGANEVWYAGTAWVSERAGAAMLALGTDDGAKVWLNGELVHTYRGARPALPGNDLVPVTVQAGENNLFVKLFNVSGPAGVTASIQPYTVEVFARRLGSPLTPLLDFALPDGNVPLRNLTGPPGDDARFDWTFTQPGPHLLTVRDLAGGHGNAYAYRIVIGPTQPTLALRSFPANPSVPRGGRVPVFVQRVGPDGARGAAEVRLDGLPPGLTAEPIVLAPEQRLGVLVLSAAPDAAPAATEVRVLGRQAGLGAAVEAVATPVDHFAIQNNPLPVERQGQAAAVVAAPAPFRLSVSPRFVRVQPGGSAKLTVTAERADGFGADINVVVPSAPGVPLLPTGIGASGTVLRADRPQGEIELTFAPTTAAWGGSEDPRAWQFVVAGVVGGDGLTGGLLACSESIALLPPTAEDRQPAPTGPGDPADRRLFEQRCSACHRLVEPTEVRKTPDAWEATVDRMINQRNAPIPPDERARIVRYLRAVAAP